MKAHGLKRSMLTIYPTAMNFNAQINTMSTVSNEVYPNQMNYGAGLLS